jgi:heptosyltransferase-2
MLNNSRILVIQTAFIGDVVLTLPLIQVLKERYPGTVIDMMLIPSTAPVVRNNPYISELIIYDKHGKSENEQALNKMNKVLKLVREKKYDIIISPHRSARSAIISFFSGAKSTISFDTSAMSFFYASKVKYRNDLHEIQRNLKLLEPLGITEDKIIRPELFPGDEEKQKVDSLLKNYGVLRDEKIIAVAPGSVWFTKRFPEEKFANLINLITERKNSHIFLIGGNSDKETGRQIQLMAQNGLLHNTIGELSILESAELIKRCEVLITNDSAPLHIANAMETKVVAIFGATVPEFGFYPYNPSDKTIQAAGLKCRPCGIHGGARCPIGTFECMKLIKEEDILKEII